jgi:hypothetical protein
VTRGAANTPPRGFSNRSLIMKKIKTILKSQNEYIREKNIENGILRLRKNQIVTFEKCKINTLIINFY